MSPADRARIEREGLLEKIARIRTEADRQIAEAESLVSDLDVFIRMSERFTEIAPTPVGPGELPSVAQDNPYRGKGLPSASTLVLQTHGREMHISEITGVLLSNGFKFAAEKPEMSVDWALKQAALQGRVKKVGPASWLFLGDGHASNSPISEESTETNPERSARTRAGLAFARDRGVNLGRPAKISEKHRLRAISLVEQGKSLQEIADLFGVHRNSLHKRITRWRTEGLFPEGAKLKKDLSEDMPTPDSPLH